LFKADKENSPFAYIISHTLKTHARTEIRVTGTHVNCCGVILFLFIAQMYLIAEPNCK
jgi:hypothetical protein